MTADVYNTQTCECENNPIQPGSCDDGDCTTEDSYNAATCECEHIPVTPPVCDDGDCTTEDSYNTATCECEFTPITPPSCDDFDCTTDDFYNPLTCECENTPIPPPSCDDGDCTTDDFYNTATCQCEHTPIPPPSCDDGDCTTADVYNTVTCECENNPIQPGSCDDGDCTTEDSYNTVTCECEHTPITPPSCDDGDCTTDDFYNPAICECENIPTTPPSCDDGDCTTDDTYNTATCMCENTPITPPSCDDGDCTTEDSYNPVTCECENTPITLATATLSGDAVICEGEITALTLNVTGTTPITVVYQDENGDLVTLNNVSDGDVISVSPTADATYALVSVTDAVCEGTVSGSATVTVDQAVVAPSVSCVGSTENSVTFGWAHPTTTEFSYTVSVGGGTPSAPVTTTDMTYTENGLTPGTEVEITVIALSGNSCPDSEAVSQICTANDCPPDGTPTITGLATMYCADDAPVMLTVDFPGGELSGPGTAPGSLLFDPAAAGNGAILLTYEYTDAATGCTYQGTAQTEVTQPLTAPVLNCGTTTTGSVEFIWTNTGVTQYEFTYFTVSGGTVIQTVNGTSYTISALMPGDEVTASVTAIGPAPCGNSVTSEEVSCVAAPCPDQTVTIDNLAPEYCSGTPAFALIGTPAGGSFSGNGISGGMFDPSAAGAGMIEIFYDYTDPATGCEYTTMQMTEIFFPLSAPVVFCGLTGTDFVTFEWSEVTGATEYIITVTSPTNGMNTQTVTGTSHTETGLAVNEVVTISVIAVGNNLCGDSAPAETSCTAQDCPSQTVTIDNLEEEYCADATSVVLSGTPAGGVFSGAGITGDTFDPAAVGAASTVILYTYTDPATDCEYSVQTLVSILPPYGAPVVTCGDNTMNSVTFNWTDVGTSEYEISVSVNGGTPTVFTTTDLFWTENGLNPGDAAEITVTAVGTAPCNNSTPGTAICFAEDCVPGTGEISGEATLCGGETATITFNFTGTGPYDVTYLTNGGTPVTLEQIFDNHTVVVSPTVSSVYTLQSVTDLGNANCAVAVSGAATVNVTTAVTAEVNVTSDFNGTDVSCAGVADGTAEVSNPSGGSAPYTYVWSNGQTGITVTDLAAHEIYTVTITDADGCSGTAEVSLTEPTPITGDINAQDPLCADGNEGWIALTEVGGGAEPYLYGINGGPLQPLDSFPDLTGGEYVLTVEDINGCAAEFVQTLVNPDPIFVDLGEDMLVTSGTELDITALTNVGNVDTLMWEASEVLDTTYNLSAELTANRATTINVMLQDENGCIGTDILQINVSKDRHVYIPNAISPNFDGVNDVFIINGGVGVEAILSVRIYDRWGEAVFTNFGQEVNSALSAWDGTYKGKMMNDQVFVYAVEILFTDGETELFKGDVTLMR